MSSKRMSERVVVAGAGIAALEVLLALRRLAQDAVSLVIVSPEQRLDYRPLTVVEPFGGRQAPSIEVEELIADVAAVHHPGAVVRVDAERRLVTTSRGETLAYDTLVIATGAVRVPEVSGALTFAARRDVAPLERLLAEVERRRSRVAFAVPRGAGWPLPVYELALLTASEARKRGNSEIELVIVTPEWRPLGLFGEPVARRVAELLEERGIVFRPSTYPVRFERGVLHLAPAGELHVDHVVALPRLEGPRIEGLPCDGDGFIPTDLYGAVLGVPAVYAAGDATTFPIKQGGIAAQQADAVAQAVAARAGASASPERFRPILRAVLLTGDEPLYLRAELIGGQGELSVAEAEALWAPPSKIVARELGAYLARADTSLDE
jgi:sulfide:quinone oxidoreductase